MQTDRERDPPSEAIAKRLKPFPVPTRLPVFPLPNVVFFPKTYLPLHIFEPRYQQMVADTMTGSQCIAMALLKEGWESNYYGNPEVYSTLCVGRIVRLQSLSDGRFNILLQGLNRCEILEEHFKKSYREATIRLKPSCSEKQLAVDVRHTLLGMLDQYLQTREHNAAWKEFFCEELGDDVLVNTFCTYLECTPLEKQFLLEADGLYQQAHRLTDLLQFMQYDHYSAKDWE